LLHEPGVGHHGPPDMLSFTEGHYRRRVHPNLPSWLVFEPASTDEWVFETVFEKGRRRKRRRAWGGFYGGRFS